MRFMCDAEFNWSIQRCIYLSDLLCLLVFFRQSVNFECTPLVKSVEYPSSVSTPYNMATTIKDTFIATNSPTIEMQTPMAASDQIVAAEVTPTTAPSFAIITPAPRKPIPVTTWPMILDGSDTSLFTIDDAAIYKYVPSTISEEVLMPTGFPFNCLSKPIIAPQNSEAPIELQLNGAMENMLSKFILYLI